MKSPRRKFWLQVWAETVKNLFQRVRPKQNLQLQSSLNAAQSSFALFRSLLDNHNTSLKLLSSIDESRESRLDPLSFWGDFMTLQSQISETIDSMIALGGQKYAALKIRLEAISGEVERNLSICTPIPDDDFVIHISKLGRERAPSVGAKSANLGELSSRMHLPVPDGFAISARAYKHFLESNDHLVRIQSKLRNFKIGTYADLESLSSEIQTEIVRKPLPADLAEKIFEAFDELAKRTGNSSFALRSSAVGEDTAFSFAGQYLTVLNVGRKSLLDEYKRIIASKFTPSVLYYLRSRSLEGFDFGMGVLCMEMVEAVSSGVAYSLDPMQVDRNVVIVNSIFGLGSPLVDGTVTPDIFEISRESLEITLARPGMKKYQLIANREGGLENSAVADTDITRLSLNQAQLAQLARWVLTIEEYFGGPQDIEWALDKSGKLLLLQARPLIIPKPGSIYSIPEEFQSARIMEGGVPICGGIGVGAVQHIASVRDLDYVRAGSILVAANPSPTLVAVMHKISGLITVVGGNTSHLATLARELNLPTVVGMERANELEAGREVTLDANRGVIYDGLHPEWQPAAQPPVSGNVSLQSKSEIDKLLAPIVRLTLIHPYSPDFKAENCRTMHDILRLIHQKAMEEIYTSLSHTTRKDKIGLRLKTKIPLAIHIIYLDQFVGDRPNAKWIPEDEIASRPMQALWSGILAEGWPETQIPADLRGFISVMGAHIQDGQTAEFSEESYAFISRDYMLLNLRMGYHFSTIEALATPEMEKNYIRMQFKLGGAPLDRRLRRIWLISELMNLMGFENHSQGDYLDSTIAYQLRSGILERLRTIGRITILTKQLDMALSSDARAHAYLEQFTQKLNLSNTEKTADYDEKRG